MYTRRLYRQTPPPGYAGNAFSQERVALPENEREEQGTEATRVLQRREPRLPPTERESAPSPGALRPSDARGFRQEDAYITRENEGDALLKAYRERQKASFAPCETPREEDGKAASDTQAPCPLRAAVALPVCVEAKSGEKQADDEQKERPNTGEASFLKKLIRSRFSLEDLLLMAVALLLASGEADDEVLLILGLLLVLMGK